MSYNNEDIRFTVYFSNNRGINVIRSKNSYGGIHNLYEIAILGKVCNQTHPDKYIHYDISRTRWAIDYTTPITSNVIGYLRWEEVEDYMLQVKDLSVRSIYDPVNLHINIEF